LDIIIIWLDDLLDMYEFDLVNYLMQQVFHLMKLRMIYILLGCHHYEASQPFLASILMYFLQSLNFNDPICKIAISRANQLAAGIFSNEKLRKVEENHALFNKRYRVSRHV